MFNQAILTNWWNHGTYKSNLKQLFVSSSVKLGEMEYRCDQNWSLKIYYNCYSVLSRPNLISIWKLHWWLSHFFGRDFSNPWSCYGVYSGGVLQCSNWKWFSITNQAIIGDKALSIISNIAAYICVLLQLLGILSFIIVINKLIL